MRKFKVLRSKVTSRGGGVEIDLTPFGFEGEKMAAYQNYLGGGMLGSIQVNDTITSFNSFVDDDTVKELEKIGSDLMRYYHSLTNPDDEWSGGDFDEIQNRPSSAY